MKKAIAILLTLIVVYLGVFAVYGPLRYRTFYGAAQQLASYRGIMDGFVPQGMTQYETSGVYLVSGFMSKSKPSRLYVYPPGEAPRCICLQKPDGSDYEGHAGGVTAVGGYVYISNAHKLFVLKTADVLAAKDGDTLAFISFIEVPCNASFCSSDGQYLYVGEYHADGYETDVTHALTFGDESFAALVFAYPVAPDGALEPDAVPVRVFATPDKVQGVAVDGDKVYLSRSGAFYPSSLETYTLDGAADTVFSYDGNDLPCCVLGEARLVRAVPMPHMSEDVEIRGGRLLLGFESCALQSFAGLVPGTLRRFASLDLQAIS
ncbi:MAG: hypothetical protein IKR49_07165 [Clostridia bacterium]|jgi:hypothetical protein|nr:hypothetical protein [Clostridia bacterium]